jgi:metal-responsive CopG/Arc/MetJ family transcriptional regulator
MVQALDQIEDHARAVRRSGFTRSEMIRDAVMNYVAPLVSLLDRSGALEGSERKRIEQPSPAAEGKLGEAVRIRFDDQLLQQLDRIEAYARGLGHRHVTRSSLIRDGVRAYLAGFHGELSRGDLTDPERRSLVIANRE